MIEMLDRVRIWTLREAGHTLEHIAVEVGVELCWPRRASRATGQTPAERIEAERKRLSLLPIPPAEKLLTEWVHHPRMNWKAQVEQLHDLLIRYGPRRTLTAIEQVLLNGKHHAKAIAWILGRSDDASTLSGEGQ
jgi:hypothetical protein